MKPMLSLVMLVRDEAEMAPAFLDSVQGLWDELIVVDSGSRDDTPAIFRAAGARLLHHPWNDDFAEGRNVGLQAAIGEWVLILDADERPAKGFASDLREHLRDERAGALTIAMSNALPYGHRRESRLLRAWRADPSIRFVHAIHEDASDSVAQVLERSHRVVRHVAPPVEHLGYVRSRAAAKDKKARDLRLLRACVAADPLDFYSRYKMLELARYWRDGTLWESCARETTDAVEVAGRACLEGQPWGGELVALVAEGLFRADSPAGLAFLDGWADRLLAAPPFFFRRGVVREHLGDLEGARHDFTRCLDFRDALGDLQLSLVRPTLGLARVALARGDADEATRLAAEAVRRAPRDPEALTAIATLLRSRQGPDELAAWEASHAREYPNCPERDWAIGEALYTLGDLDGALARLRLAAGVPPAGPAGVRLAQALLATGQPDLSEAACRAVLPSDAEAGLGVLLFDLIHGRDTTLDLELTPASANAAMRHWVDALWAARVPTLRSRFARNARAVSELFPWLGAYLERKTA